MKTPANLKKYSGKLEPGVHYFEKGDKIVFPQANSPYNPKAYLQKVLTTIMDNSKLDYKIVDVEVGDDLGRTAEKPKKEEIDSFRDKHGVIRVSMNIFSFKGTLKSEVNRIWDNGNHVIFDIDVFGGLKIKNKFLLNFASNES